jgi:general stress protein 26
MISSKKAITAVEKWLQKALRSSNNISKLVGTIDNDDDPRIRPMTKAEEMDLQQYFKNENEILLTKRIIEVGASCRCVARI